MASAVAPWQTCASNQLVAEIEFIESNSTWAAKSTTTNRNGSCHFAPHQIWSKPGSPTGHASTHAAEEPPENGAK
jgi:hypothetical protein